MKNTGVGKVFLKDISICGESFFESLADVRELKLENVKLMYLSSLKPADWYEYRDSDYELEIEKETFTFHVGATLEQKKEIMRQSLNRICRELNEDEFDEVQEVFESEEIVAGSQTFAAIQRIMRQNEPTYNENLTSLGDIDLKKLKRTTMMEFLHLVRREIDRLTMELMTQAVLANGWHIVFGV